MVSRRSRLLQFILGSAVLAAGHFCAPLGHAEAIVSGADNNLTIEARDTSLQDVLNALGAKFDLRVRGLSSLNRQVEGRYEGSLRAVVTRLVNGYDYVLKTDSGTSKSLSWARQSRAKRDRSMAKPCQFQQSGALTRAS